MKRYYSARKNPKSLSIQDLYWKVQHLYFLFREKDYFKGYGGITQSHLKDEIKHAAALPLGFQPFPLEKWASHEVTEEHLFDLIEFLYEHAARPGTMVQMTSDTGYNYEDYDGYDKPTGQAEFRGHVNTFLCDYKPGFELTDDGRILSLGSNGLAAILDAEIEPYDAVSVDGKVRDAILKWRNTLSWPKIAVELGLSKSHGQTYYGFLCSYAHSGYLSAFQMLQSAGKNSDPVLRASSVGALTIAAAHQIDLYCQLFPQCRVSLEAVKKEHERVTFWLELDAHFDD